MSDFVQRFVFEQQDARGCIVGLLESCQAIQATHHYPAALARLLNQFAASVVLLHDSIKIKGTVTIQLRTQGAISLLMADCFDSSLDNSLDNEQNNKKIRAIAEYDAQQLPAGDAIKLDKLGKDAVLAITITPDKGERYQGIVPIESADLADCLQDYFARSEQLPTWFKIASDENSAMAIALHALPKQKVTDDKQSKENFERLHILLNTLSEQEALELNSQDILTRLFHQEQCRLFDSKAIEFGCQCSYQKSLDAVLALGKLEIAELIKEQKGLGNSTVDIDCHFCFQRYPIDLESISARFDFD